MLFLKCSKLTSTNSMVSQLVNSTIKLKKKEISLTFLGTFASCLHMVDRCKVYIETVNIVTGDAEKLAAGMELAADYKRSIA